MTTKVEHINDAYSQIRISGITIQPTPEDLATALVRLENMMAEFYGDTMDLNYNFESQPNANTESGIDRAHHSMIATNLAVRLIPDFNKTVPDKLYRLASGQLATSESIVVRDRIKSVQPSRRMPRGSGNRQFIRSRYNPEPVVLKTDAANHVMYIGDVKSLTESFVEYLMDDEIDTYTISTSDGLSVLSDALNSSNSGIDYQIEAVANAVSNGYETIQIVVNTVLGDETTRIYTVEIKTRELT